ncbi:hypothetical protein DFH11DRAFT_1732938 [Phellopilus nigrolimitatus]|nr:hypothetical protein DFH11DRAFT_1732938 [Phellopilus nigrolimitatus]
MIRSSQAEGKAGSGDGVSLAQGRGRNQGAGRGGRRKRDFPSRVDRTSEDGRGEVPERVGDSSGSWKRDKPKPTHFLSIPLGHIPAVREAVSSFTSALSAQSSNVPIKGLDESIIIPARRLHLTLGVMNLKDHLSMPLSPTSSRPPEVLHTNSGNLELPEKTVTSAFSLLQSLRPRILGILDGAPLRVPLQQIGILKPERGDPGKAHVMYVGPIEDVPCTDSESQDVRRLALVCKLLNEEFLRAGLVINDKRPLKLHCTLLNTAHRRPRPKKAGWHARTPFSFSDVLASDAFRAISKATTTSPNTGSRITVSTVAPISSALESSAFPTHSSSDQVSEINTPDTIKRDFAAFLSPLNTPDLSTTTQYPSSAQGARGKVGRGQQVHHGHPVDLGTYIVSEVQVCRMGSWGPEGEYECVGRIEL